MTIFLRFAGVLLLAGLIWAGIAMFVQFNTSGENSQPPSPTATASPEEMVEDLRPGPPGEDIPAAYEENSNQEEDSDLNEAGDQP